MDMRCLSSKELDSRYLSAKVWPTFACTLGCPRCAVRDAKGVHPGYELSWEQYTRFIDRVCEQRLHLGLLDFSGGEPTLWPYLALAIRYAKDRKVANTIRVMTNGLNRDGGIYGDADLVVVSHYGGINRADILRLKGQLGRRLSVTYPVHIDPDFEPQPASEVLPANCTCIRLCLIGDVVYPCAMAGVYGRGGWSVEEDFYDLLRSGHPDVADQCRSCFTNYRVTSGRIPPITIEGGVWNAPYTFTFSFGGRFVRLRRWAARRYMQRLAKRSR